METLLSVCVGIGLSAACGFRVFVPLFALGLTARFGHVPLHAHFQWLASIPALTALGVATVCEILGYFIPFVDHLLDVMASPMAIIAGVFVTAAAFTNDSNPWLQWSLAVIAGGGVAATTQFSTAFIRALSTLTTGGIVNPLFALGEAILAAVVSVLAMLFPILVAGVIILTLTVTLRRFTRSKISSI